MPSMSPIFLLVATLATSAALAGEGKPLAVPATGEPAPASPPKADLEVLEVAPILVEHPDSLGLRIRPGAEDVVVCPPRGEGFPAWDPAEVSFDVGPNFVSVQCVTDEMSYERVAFVTLDGRLVDLAPVQAARAKRFPNTQCIWGRPVGARLVFWDYDRFGAPYSCADDSNADGGFTIPRHYVLDPTTGKVETVEHDPPCASLLALGDEPRCVPVVTGEDGGDGGDAGGDGADTTHDDGAGTTHDEDAGAKGAGADAGVGADEK